MENKKLILKNIKLIPYEEKYFYYIYECYQEYNSRYLFTNELVIQSKREMWDYLKKKIASTYHEIMIAMDNTNSKPIGFVYSYNYNIYNEYLYITLYIRTKERNSILGAEVGAIFLDYLFKYYPIRKIYCTVYDYNKNSMKFLKNAGFKAEGILKKHRYFNNQYHDMHIMALYRKDLYELLKRLGYKEYGKK